MVDRFLNFMSIDDRETHGSKLASFNLILLLTIVVHQVADERFFSAGLILACALVGLNERYRRVATAVVFGVLLVRYGFDFPSVANHSYLELLLLSLYLWIDSSKAEEKELFLQACRWLTVIVFFYSGVQKLWYGEYFDGRYLAYLAGMADRSRIAFEFLIPPQEMARLISYKREAGSGPFLIDSVIFKVVSNGAWISEIVLSLLLLFRGIWPLAVACAIFTMFVIEFIAREFIFGILMISLLFLFCRRDMNRPLLPVYVVSLSYFVAVRLGWVPWVYWV
jgi:uncharacterized membrane protein YphA (DoxX/SURF4 family)